MTKLKFIIACVMFFICAKSSAQFNAYITFDKIENSIDLSDVKENKENVLQELYPTWYESKTDLISYLIDNINAYASKRYVTVGDYPNSKYDLVVNFNKLENNGELSAEVIMINDMNIIDVTTYKLQSSKKDSYKSVEKNIKLLGKDIGKYLYNTFKSINIRIIEGDEKMTAQDTALFKAKFFASVVPSLKHDNLKRIALEQGSDVMFVLGKEKCEEGYFVSTLLTTYEKLLIR